MKYFYDTEFIEDGKTIDLISIGVITAEGKEFYAESLDADLSRANDWVKENVITHLWSRQPDKKDANRWSRDGGSGGLMSRRNLATALTVFVAENSDDEKPEFWGYYADYDHVVLCQLFGTMLDLPKSWPMYTRDIKQLCDALGNPKLPEQGKGEHHALADARWNKLAYEFLTAPPPEQQSPRVCGDCKHVNTTNEPCQELVCRGDTEDYDWEPCGCKCLFPE